MAEGIIKIGVDDDDFNEMVKRWEDWKKSVGDMPPEWQKINKLMEEAASIMDGASEGDGGQLKETVKDTEKLGGAWDVIHKSSIGINTALKETGSIIGRILPGMGSLSLGLGAVLGLPAAGFAMLAGLSRGVANEGTVSGGLGESIGQTRAYTQLYSRWGFGESNLENIAAQQRDSSQTGYLMQASGLHNRSEVQSATPAELSQIIMQHLRDINAQGDSGHQRAWNIAQQQGISSSQFGNIINASPEEFAKQRAQFAPTAASMNIGQGGVNAAQDFEQAMEQAATSLKTTIFKDLIPLAPAIEGIVKQLGDVFGTLISSPEVKNALKSLSVELDEFNKYLGSPQFKTDLNNFETQVAAMAHGMERVAAFIDKWLPSETSDTDKAKIAATAAAADVPEPISFGGDTSVGAAANARNAALVNKYVVPAAEISGSLYGAVGSSMWDSIKRYYNPLLHPQAPGFVGPPVPDGLKTSANPFKPVDAASPTSNAVSSADTLYGRTNNPLNLKYIGQAGATNVGGYAGYPTQEAGIRADANQIMVDITKHHEDTISKLVKGWATDASPDKQAQYARDVSKAVGIDPNKQLDITNNPQLLAQLVRAMSVQEVKNAPSQQQVNIALKIQNQTGADTTKIAGSTAY